MEWTGTGIVLGHRRHGESSVILEVMTRDRGRHLGLVRGGKSRRMAALLQVGNTLSLIWRARLDEHLGLFLVEAETLRGALLMDDPVALLATQLCAAHLRHLPERDPHVRLHDMLALILERRDDPATMAALVARFELVLLEELGFGLDLSRCAATGATSGLVYVSPRTGRAVSAAAGEPYRERLLPLPGFLSGSLQDVSPAAAAEALALTAFFLNRDVWGPRALRPPEAREALIRRACAPRTGAAAEPAACPPDKASVPADP